MLIHDQAFVLHSRPYRETSLLLECLTREHGRLGVVARGVRRERARLQRAQLEPFQPIWLDLLSRGELATLRGAEPAGASHRLVGEAGLSGLYANELVVRLTGRQDPQPSLFDAYAQTVARLATGQSLAWALRRFERDLLDAAGYALPLDADAAGQPIDPARCYRYHPEEGAWPASSDGTDTVAGTALLALSTDQAPAPADLPALRRMMRQVIRHHLGGAELKAWRVLAPAPRR